MKAKMGIKPAEKLLGNSSPVMLSNMAWGKNVSKNTTNSSIKSNRRLPFNANFCCDVSGGRCRPVRDFTASHNPLALMLPDRKSVV